MSSGSSYDSGRTSTVNLVRTSHPWTRADSAAGFVLRYLAPMRRQLTEVLGSGDRADEALKLLLAHLVSVGFGEHNRGRLRDFLLRGIRSAAKNCLADSAGGKQNDVNLDVLKLESKQWITYWREGLLERAWRALERHEHTSADPPVYSVLHYSTANQDASPEKLVMILRSESGIDVDAATVSTVLPEARALFAQLVADEVAETLESPTGDDVKKEIGQLGLGKAFNGIAVVAHPH
jgi:hypothetical protein